MTETAWFDGTAPARLTWDDNNTIGYLSFIDPNGDLAVIPVTAGDSDAATAERGTNVWHIDAQPGAVEGDATVSPSIHFLDRWHSPNPVAFTLVAELEGETPTTPAIEPSGPVNVDPAAPPVEAPPTQEPAPGEGAEPPASPEPAPAPVSASPGEGPGAADAGAAAPATAAAPVDAGTDAGTDVAAADSSPPAPSASVEQPPSELIVTLTTSSHVHTLPCSTSETGELAQAMELAVDQLRQPRP